MGQESDRVVAALERTVARTVTKISLDIVANLVRAPSEDGTPLDTGWASANWIPAIRSASRFDGDRYLPDEGDVAEAKGEQQQGQAKLLTYRLGQGSVFVSNNVPYVPKLNDRGGKETQPGFIERAIDKALTVDFLSLSGGAA